MNKRQAKIKALGSIAALVDVNANSGDEGDLWASAHDWSDTDRERFRAACLQVADELAARAARLAARQDGGV